MNLNIGQTFKNYKELCAFLEEPTYAGKAKQIQEAKWQPFFSYTKEGHKITITQVFKPFSLEERLKRAPYSPRSGLFLDDFSVQIIQALRKKMNSSFGELTYNSVFFTTEIGLTSFGFVNEEFANLDSFSWESFKPKEPQLPSDFPSDFKSLIQEIKKTPLVTYTENPKIPLSTKAIQSRIWRDASEIISNSLKILDERKIITYSNTWIVKTTKDTPFRLASVREQNLISAASAKLFLRQKYKDKNIKTENDLFYKDMNKEFYLDRLEILKKECGIFSCKKAHVISYTPVQMKLGKEFEDELKQAKLSKTYLNSNFKGKLSSYYSRKLLNPLNVQVVEMILQKALTLSEEESFAHVEDLPQPFQS